MAPPDDPAQVEDERQVVAAVERYREVVRSMEAGGRPPTGQHAAEKAVGRALQLVAFVLKRSSSAGITLERLAELTGWEPELIQEVQARPAEPALVGRVAPPGVDPAAVAQAAASFEAVQRLEALLAEVRADVVDDSWSPAAADLDDLHDRVETAWRAWRHALGRSRDQG